jgi:inorganic pyrophosphatase
MQIGALSAPPLLLLRDLLAQHFPWAAWENIIATHGVTNERPRHSRHPLFHDIIYPLDYGYVNSTRGPDGSEVDIFTGTAPNGLVALIATDDHRRADRDVKLLYNCTPEEIYLVNGFINFNPTLMQGVLIMRHPMHELWSHIPHPDSTP